MKESISDKSKGSPEPTNSQKKKGVVAFVIMTIVLVSVGYAFINYLDVDDIPVGFIDDVTDSIDDKIIIEGTEENDMNFPVEIFDELEEVIIEAPKEIIKELEAPEVENTFESNVDVEPDVINKVKEIPLTVLDMAKFVSQNPTLTEEDTDLLISYVVGKEHGFEDAKRDLAVEKLMEKYLE